MDFNYVIDRIREVIRSCENEDQIEMAIRYCDMLINKCGNRCSNKYKYRTTSTLRLYRFGVENRHRCNLRKKGV